MSSSSGGAYGFGPKGIVYSAVDHHDAQKTICGLCEKKDAIDLWPTDISHVIHKACHDSLKIFVNLIETKLNESFPSKIHGILKQKAQSQAFTAIRPHLNKKSFVQFSQEKPEELKELIEKVAYAIIIALKPK
jgi:hypothetical protein